MHQEGYARRIQKRRPIKTARTRTNRLNFCLPEENWTDAHWMTWLFMDEVWATGGSHGRVWAAQKVDGSEALNDDQVIETKAKKKEGWMFTRSIVGTEKVYLLL